MKKLLILLLVLSSCVVNRYTCSCDHTCTFEPGAVTNLPTLNIGEVTPKIYWGHDTWNTLLAKSGTVVWSPLATDTTLTFLGTTKAGPVMINKWDIIADEADKATKNKLIIKQ